MMITHSNSATSSYYDSYTGGDEVNIFNPADYIQMQEDGYAVCSNPMVDGGLSSITVNTKLIGEGLRNFEASIKRMVLAKLFSPKFAEVILTATRISNSH